MSAALSYVLIALVVVALGAAVVVGLVRGGSPAPAPVEEAA